MKFDRALQIRLKEVAIGLVSEATDRRHTFVYAVPGGGKSTAACLFFDVLRRAGRVMNVLWVVPRNNLRRQAAREFKRVAKALGCKGLHLNTVAARGGRLLTPGDPTCVGFVTTFQALHLAGNVEHYVSQMQLPGGPWLVIFDECHHLADPSTAPHCSGRPWIESAAEIEKRAWHTLLMTGTPERDDGAEIPYVTYKSVVNESGVTVRMPEIHVQYTFREAIADRAVIPFEFMRGSGHADFERSDGGSLRMHTDDVLSESGSRKMIGAFLDHEGYWLYMLDDAVEHFFAHRAVTGYDSHMLVICESQSFAKIVSLRLKEITKGARVKTVVAVSEDGAEGRHVLNEFRGDMTPRRKDGKGCAKRPEILVTCAMAHEGFDAPAVSHLVYLSDVRSLSWTVQALFRGNRVDYAAIRAGVSWERQRCFAFVSNDQLMRKITDAIERDQIEGISRGLPAKGGSSSGPGVSRTPALVSVGATLTEFESLVVYPPGQVPSWPAPPPEAPVDERTDKTTFDEISRLAARRDVLVGRGRTGKDLKIVFGDTWRTGRKGRSLLAVRDYLRHMSGAASAAGPQRGR